MIGLPAFVGTLSLIVSLNTFSPLLAADAVKVEKKADTKAMKDEKKAEAKSSKTGETSKAKAVKEEKKADYRGGGCPEGPPCPQEKKASK